MFFNPRQHRVREGIVNSLARFGHPQIVEAAGQLSIRFTEHEAQILFAYDQDGFDGKPVGVVVFLRTAPDEVAIMHIAVDPDYALHGNEDNSGLGIVLIEKVKEICSRVVGVRRIVFFYRQEVVIRI